MTSDETHPYPGLVKIASEVQRIIDDLPEGVSGAMDLRKHSVHMKLQGPKSPAFKVVLGSEVPDIVYDSRFLECVAIGSEIDDHLEFARETANEIVNFILSGRKPTEHKSKFLRRTYLLVPLSDGTEWKMRKFSAD